MNKNADLRVSRTHHMLKVALFELMEEIGFEKVTIKNLTEQAKISRTTFYLHYQDKFDLLDKIEDEILDGFINLSRDAPLDELVSTGLTHEKTSDFLLQLYRYIQEHQLFFRLMLTQRENLEFHTKLSRVIQETAKKRLKFHRLAIPEHYAIALVMSIHTSFILEWLKTDMKETPEEMVSMITKIMHNIPQNLIQTKEY